MPAQIYWFTGLSGSGKSTVAAGVKARLEGDGASVMILDGDAVRARDQRRLGFSEEEIKKNNARVAVLCGESRGAHDVVLVPIISPYRASRRDAREKLAPGFFEIYLNADLPTVAARDVKGLYAKAKKGEIPNLIGFSPEAPYEPPDRPDLVLDTANETTERSVSRLYDFITSNLGRGREEPSTAGPEMTR